MTTNFKFNNGGTVTDTDDVFIRRDLFTTGGLWTWGGSLNGQLGDNTITHKSSPIQTVAGGTNWKLVAAGQYNTAGIKSDGTLWIWGHNTHGQLGDNSVVWKSSPVQTVSGGTNWKQVACAGYHTLAIKTDGTLWLWGRNQYGQMGNNTITHRSSPVQTIAGGTNWKQVTGGAYHYCAAIKTDGTLWTWGFNSDGQLGDNTTTVKSSPVQTVAAGTNWKQVSSGRFHITAIKTDGTLWTWGYNNQGQLGENTVASKSSPVQTVAGGTDWKLVGSGNYHIAAIKTDGTLWNWGNNQAGQLGDNTRVPKSSPVQTIAGGTNWKQVTGGNNLNMAIKTDGTLWLWGRNFYGGLGTNDITHRSSPVQTVAGGTNWKLVSSGYSSVSATREDYY